MNSRYPTATNGVFNILNTHLRSFDKKNVVLTEKKIGILK